MVLVPMVLVVLASGTEDGKLPSWQLPINNKRKALNIICHFWRIRYETLQTATGVKYLDF
jgi:hypothetical protein